jgi:hypothetical protein
VKAVAAVGEVVEVPAAEDAGAMAVADAAVVEALAAVAEAVTNLCSLASLANPGRDAALALQVV